MPSSFRLPRPQVHGFPSILVLLLSLCPATPLEDDSVLTLVLHLERDGISDRKELLKSPGSRCCPCHPISVLVLSVTYSCATFTALPVTVFSRELKVQILHTGVQSVNSGRVTMLSPTPNTWGRGIPLRHALHCWEFFRRVGLLGLFSVLHLVWLPSFFCPQPRLLQNTAPIYLWGRKASRNPN